MKVSGGRLNCLWILCWCRARSLAAAHHQLLPRQRECVEAMGAGLSWLILRVCFWDWSNSSHPEDQTTAWSLESRADVAAAWGTDGRKAARSKENPEKRLSSMHGWGILGIKLGVCLSMLTVHEVWMLLLQHCCGSENTFRNPRLSVRTGLHLPVGVQHWEACSELILGVCISRTPYSNQPPVLYKARFDFLTRPIVCYEAEGDAANVKSVVNW